jgi:aminoglycoside phosphotransferase (APT) family kinase protein
MLDDRPGVLVDGDLGNMEIFVDDSDRVVDIVDFGKAGVGDPAYDFVRFCGGGPIDDPRPDALLPRVRGSYRAHGGAEPANWEELFRIYSVYNAVDNSAWSIREDIPWLPGLLKKVGDLLDILETSPRRRCQQG